MANRYLFLIRTLLFLFIILGNYFYSNSQNIFISTLKHGYTLKDTIVIKLANKNVKEIYYSIGLEAKNQGRWVDLEPTINKIGKVEIVEKMSSPAIKYIKVVLPHPLGYALQQNGPIYIRFRLRSAYSNDDKNLQLSYTDPILVTLN
jgi:hypothetical protein